MTTTPLDTPVPPEVHTLAAAYALHALPTAEVMEFEQHLPGCDTCPQDVRDFRATAAVLGSIAAVAPAAELRRRVLDAVVGVEQEPPGAPGILGVADLPESTGAPGSPGSVASPGVTPLVPRQRQAPQRSSWPVRLLAAAAVVFAALAGTFGVTTYRADQETDRLTAANARLATTNTQVAQLLTAADATVTPTDIRDGGRASVINSVAATRLAVVATGVQALGPDQTYQLWYVGDPQNLQDIESAGLATVSAGELIRVVDREFDPGSAFAISIEPAGGSDQPTVDEIVAVAPIPTS